MAGSPPTLPPEIWLYIHRLVVSEILPPSEVDEVIKYGGTTPDHPLNDRDLQNFLKAAGCLQRVCQLWATLAQELLYENIWVNDSTTRWASLSSALGQPNIASLVRNARLSPTRVNHNVSMLQHCGSHIAVLVQPEFPRSGPFCASPRNLTLPPLLSLTRVYWIESKWSAPLLCAVLAAAPNVKHLTLSSSPSIGSAFSTAVLSASGPVFPSLSRLQSLVLLPLRPSCAYALLHDADLTRLTHLTIVPGHLEWKGFPVLPALHTLTLFDDRTRTLVPFPVILIYCPALEELRYSGHISAKAPMEEQMAGALTCVRIYLGLWLLQPVRAHAKILLGPAFGALERVVLDGPGWAGALELDEWAQLRVRGCAVEEGNNTPSGDY